MGILKKLSFAIFCWAFLYNSAFADNLGMLNGVWRIDIQQSVAQSPVLQSLPDKEQELIKQNMADVLMTFDVRQKTLAIQKKGKELERVLFQTIREQNKMIYINEGLEKAHRYQIMSNDEIWGLDINQKLILKRVK